MATITKEQAMMLVFDNLKLTSKKTKETYESLKEKGYICVSDIAKTQVPSSYFYSEKENRLFYSLAGITREILKAVVKYKGWVAFGNSNL